MMFCSKCGSELKSDAKFCENCGTKVINEEIKKNDLKEAKNEVSREEETKSLPVLCIIAYILLGIIVLNQLLGIGSIGSLFRDNASQNLIFLFIVNFIFTPIFYIVGLTMTLVAKFKYSKNTHTTILVVLYIVMGIILAIEIISVITIIGSCINQIQNCNYS